MTNAAEPPSTRDRILAAAVAEIAERGIGGARTRSIAERAGVNNALVHYHFKSMDGLVAEAAAGVFVDLADAAVASLTTVTVAEGMRQMIEMVGTVDPTEPGWQVLMEVMLHTPRQPELGEMVLGWLREYRRAMKERLDRAIEEGELAADVDSEGLSLALMALYDGLGLYAYVDPSLDVRRAGIAITELLTRRGDTP